MRSPYLRMAGPSSKGRTSLDWRGRSTRKWLVCSRMQNEGSPLLDNGLHHRRLEVPNHLLIGGLNHQETDEFLFRVHPEVCSKCALPAEGTVGEHDVPRRGICDDADAKSPGFAASAAGQGICRVRRTHKLDGPGAEEPLSVRLAAVHEHLSELRIVLRSA